MNQKAHTTLKLLIRAFAVVMLLAFLQNNVFSSLIIDSDSDLFELVDLADDNEEDGEDKDEKEEKEERALRFDEIANYQNQIEINVRRHIAVFNYLLKSSAIDLDIGTPPPELTMC